MPPARHLMQSADSAWLRMDRPTNLMVITSVLWFDETLDWGRVRELIRERIVEPFPPFRRRVRSGLPLVGPLWEDDPDFDIDLHLHRSGLPAPGDAGALQELVGDLASRPLDRSRPLWEFHLVEGYEGTGSAIVVRMHHCIADGIALARVMLSMTDLDDKPLDAFTAPADGRRGLPFITPVAQAAAAAAQGGIDLLQHPSRIPALARRGAVDAVTLARLLGPAPETPSSLKGRQRPRHRVAWTRPARLSTIKDAGHRLGVTVNDVLVAAVAGAVGAHLRAGGEHVPGLHAMVPFNLRPLDQPLSPELGNRFGLVLLDLPVGVEDPLERVLAVHEAMRAIKESDQGPLAYGILEALGRTPGRVESVAIDFFSGKASMVLTNVPGPTRRVSFAGAPVRGVLVWAPCSGSIGMSVSMFSYAGSVTVGFLTDAGLIPEPDRLAARFRRELSAITRTPAAR